MRLHYRKDGRDVECWSIHESGVEGQMVVLTNIELDKRPDSQLAPYQQPAFFTIVAVDESRGYYTVRDEKGRTLELMWELGSYLYDAGEWARWNEGRMAEKLRRKQGRIAHLEGVVTRLENILVRQGGSLQEAIARVERLLLRQAAGSLSETEARALLLDNS